MMLSSEQTQNKSQVTALVFVALMLWLALVLFLGARGSFVRAPGGLPLPILIGVTAPLLVFFAAFWTLRAFHNFVLTVDLRLVTGIQAWRFAGLGFLALYTHGVLPALFAWPAGLGDMAIGLTAPWIVLALIRVSGFATSRLFMAWNLLGISDLVVAVSTGAMGSALATGAAGEITTAPMAQLPLVLIPAFLVPFFIMLHLTALVQAATAGGVRAFKQTDFTRRRQSIVRTRNSVAVLLVDRGGGNYGDHVESHHRAGA